MPIITSNKSKPEYDVVIVGSGAGGGQMAYTLTLAGLKCVMLEAGRNYDPGTVKEFNRAAFNRTIDAMRASIRIR